MSPIEETKTIELRKPVTFGSLTIERLALREPTAGELAKAVKEPTNIDASITLIHLVAGIPREAAEKLGRRDFQEADRFLDGFAPDFPATGAT